MTDGLRYVAGYVVGSVVGAVAGYVVARWLPRRLPVQACGKLEAHGQHRHSPVASRLCPGVVAW